MSKIHVMSDQLANKIAAGEVVERISSVVKELVENSIDAKSKSVVVDLLDSGTKSIKVTDDGIGMDREDASLAFQRHATSKLIKDDDLFFINTLGFRGEALPSIASVSKVDLKTSQGDVGTHLSIVGGKQEVLENSDARKGTCIEIADLFFNTPARLKYLKSDSTELANVTAFIEKLALSHAEVSFTLTNNGKKIIYTSGSGDLLKTIHEIYGYTVSSNMIEISASSDDYDIRGYICKPQILKSNRNHITTIVNGRIVRNVMVNQAINDGYFSFKPDSKYPVVILVIDTDPTLIDVNIHPTKQDIKFSKIEELNKMITETIGDALRKTLLVQKMEVNHTTVAPFVIEESKEESNVLGEEETEYFPIPKREITYTKLDIEKEVHTFQQALDLVSSSSDASKDKNEDIKKLELNPVGVALQTYIIAENPDGLFLIDQHAAHERINYERVWREMESKQTLRKMMLFPITIELTPSDFRKLTMKKEELEEMGFVLEEFGFNTIIVKEHPIWLKEGMEEILIRQIFDILIDETKVFDRMKFLNRVVQTTACRMSVMAHETITMEQAKEILSDLVKCDNPYNCAHGRPTIIHYSTYELEKMFKRIMN